MNKHYYVAKATKSENLQFIHGYEKVSELIFNDLLDAKIKELLGAERMDQFEEVKSKTMEALLNKTPVCVMDRSFEIRFKK